MNICSKPGCTRAGAAVLGYDYAARLALLQDPPETGAVSPHLYVLCAHCAERLRPPQGWMLDDTRSEPPLFVAAEPPVGPLVLHDGSGLDEGSENDSEEASSRRQLFFGYSA